MHQARRESQIREALSELQKTYGPSLDMQLLEDTATPILRECLRDRPDASMATMCALARDGLDALDHPAVLARRAAREHQERTKAAAREAAAAAQAEKKAAVAAYEASAERAGHAAAVAAAVPSNGREVDVAVPIDSAGSLVYQALCSLLTRGRPPHCVTSDGSYDRFSGDHASATYSITHPAMGEVRVSLEGHLWAKPTDGGLDGLLQGLTPNPAHVCAVRVSRTAAPQQAEHAEVGAKTFSYEELKSGVPAGVDPTKKEQYLSDADFEKIMMSSRSEFNEMKAWKQAQLKKAAGL